MTEITDLNPVDASNTALTGNGIQGTNFVSNFDNAMRSLLGLLGRMNSGAAPIADTFTIADPGDLTKRFRFDGGLITAGQTRVITVPDTNITLGDGTAASITFTPAGNIAATDVQAAIQELDTEKQPLDASLTAYAALVTAADKGVYYSGADTPVTFDFVANGRSLVGQNYAGMRALLDLEAGTDFNVYSANLAEWSGINPSANGGSLVAAADYAAMRALLDLEVGTDFLSPAAIAAAYPNAGLFIKASPGLPVFIKTGAATLSVKAGTLVEVDGNLITFATDTAITMPALSAGADVAIWVQPDGEIVATLNHIAPPVAGARKIGGAHYAPGGNAAAFNSGGNTTPQFNEHSIWDLKFRPACPDPRGMTLVAGKFWVDIYLCGVNHHSDGTSKYNVTIADGSSPPKVPPMFGGNGSTAYSTMNWWEAAEVMMSHGKELLSYEEFAAAMFGTKEAQSGGTDPVSTILRADYTSNWGVHLATGNMWVWSREFSYRTDATGWAWGAVTGGRGSVYKQGTYGLVAALLGGSWVDAADAGSRASYWGVNAPWDSYVSIGARGRCDHLSHV